MKQTGIISMYLIAAIAVLTLLLAGAGFALKKQIEVNGEQRARIEEQATAMKQAEKLRQEAEAATLQRDKKLTQINETNRRLQNEITKAITGDACADRPIPAALDRLLRERAPKAGEGVPARNPATG
jgi:FKBP-type peptidyl-prolyl cis-trans isomerase